MPNQSYKKYLKKPEKSDYSLVKIFVISFLGMILFFTLLITKIFPTADVSIGEYSSENEQTETQNLDGRLSMIQDEDQGRSFKEIFAKNSEKENEEKVTLNSNVAEESNDNKEVLLQKEDIVNVPAPTNTNPVEPVYKVFIGNYSSAEQAKIAKDIIAESGANYNMIIKCLGTNNYSIQIGIFKNRTGAENLLYSVQQNHLPGRIVQDY